MTGPLPAAGHTAIFSVFTTSWVPPAPLPPESPWTYVAEADSMGVLELDDGPPLGEALGVGGAA